VINPATGYPGITTSLRGCAQMEVTINADSELNLNPQTALYKLLSTLIHEDHSLAVDSITKADIPLTKEERVGFSLVPTTVDLLRDTAGLLPETKLTVLPEITSMLEAQLRKSTANVRPGHRIAGSIIFGRAGARLQFNISSEPKVLQLKLLEFFESINPFNLKITLRMVLEESKTTSFDLILTSATKDPHSGVNGGPFPVAELQLARMIDQLIQNDGSPVSQIAEIHDKSIDKLEVKTFSLYVEEDETAKPFEDQSAKAMVEIRLAPGNKGRQAIDNL
jgi:hypothetical protein